MISGCSAVGSVLELYWGVEEQEQILNKIASKDIKIITLTITEGGYSFNDADLARGLDAVFAMGKLTALLYVQRIPRSRCQRSISATVKLRPSLVALQ